MNLLSNTWLQVKEMLSQGVSIIPIRDKPQIYNKREYAAKTPYGLWKKYQQEIITEASLFYLMTEKYDTNAIGIVGGKISGNLEIIDIDVKNWQGIDAKLFTDIKSFFPNIFDKLRIHQTPSKGSHILYKISDHEVPGNLKLAYKDEAKEAAIETRGEGGYVAAPPAIGYKVVKNNPIPTITWNERCSLISLCESYNERRKIVTLAPTASSNNFYDENPFEDFNNSPAAESVLTNNGWKVEGSNSNFIWFCRPEKNKGISASFNRVKRVYYIFTSSTIFEPSKGYNPASALALIQFNNDKKKTYSWLIDNGYGKINAKKETEKAKILAKSKIELPKNFSKEAVEIYKTQIETENELHPFGIFWEYNDKEKKIGIEIEALYQISYGLGFRYYNGNVVRIIDWVIYKVSEREFQDTLKAYIKDEDIKILNAYENFMHQHTKYVMKRIPLLDKNEILTDDANTCYKFFNNGFLKITKEKIEFNEYANFNYKVFEERIQKRDYNEFIGGKYIEYLKLAISNNIDYVSTIMGFLSHEWKDETTGYIIVLSEVCKNPEDGGGSGKNIFCNLLKQCTTYTSKSGVQAKFDEKFFQSWNGQKIMGISDVPKNFDYSFLKEASTGTFILKKLFKDEVEVDVKDAPKFIIQTNYSYDSVDGGLKRRIVPIEFTDFFTKCGGIDVHFGCHFPLGWDSNDWGGFDTYVAQSVQLWLNSNKKIEACKLTTTGWEKQFEQNFGTTIYNFIRENIDNWCEQVEVYNDDFKNTIENYYNENSIQKQFQPSLNKINKGLMEWCKKNEIVFVAEKVNKINNITKKCRLFGSKTPF